MRLGPRRKTLNQVHLTGHDQNVARVNAGGCIRVGEVLTGGLNTDHGHAVLGADIRLGEGKAVGSFGGRIFAIAKSSSNSM